MWDGSIGANDQVSRFEGHVDIDSTDNSPGRSALTTWWLGVAILLLGRLTAGYLPYADPIGWLWITRLGELWTVGGVLVWALWGVPYREIVFSLGRIRAATMALVLVLMFAGQYLAVRADGYPFASWNMYTVSADSVTYGEVRLTRAGQDLGHLPLTRPTSLSKEPRAVTERLWNLAIRAEEGDAVAEEAIFRALTTLVGRLESEQPDSVTFRTCVVSDPTPETPVDCETVAVIELVGPS
ncbi:hypothetical protein BH23ACT5_BH23ACT5_22120 [soil metagenome]